MKITSMADIHGDFETFDKALKHVKASDVDVLAITGDLSGRVFPDKERESFVKYFRALAQLLPRVNSETNGQVRTITDTARFLLQSNVKASGDLKKAAGEYLRLEELAHGKMLVNYRGFKDRFNDLENSGKKVLLVPGNWDGKCIDDFLAHSNLHAKHYEEVNGVKFVGYGGVKEHPVELPPDLTTDFSADEAYAHLAKFEDAEVVLIHDVPRGFESGRNHKGEFSLLAYLYRNAPSLVLTGHIHQPFAAREGKTKTLVANPGNLGQYGKNDFGTFLEFEIDENTYTELIATHKVVGNKVMSEEITSKEPEPIASQ